MRFIKVLLLVIFIFLALLFVAQNSEVLAKTLQVQLDLYFWKGLSQPMPVILLIGAAFLLGALFSMVFFISEKMRLGSRLKDCRSRMAGLEQELNSLRNLPLEEQSYPSSGGEESGA
jgi:putative membrane protein